MPLALKPSPAAGINGRYPGALVGVVLAYAPRRNRSTVQVIGLLGVIMVCLLAVAVKLMI